MVEVKIDPGTVRDILLGLIDTGVTQEKPRLGFFVL
jgi:hypothetical protein